MIPDVLDAIRINRLHSAYPSEIGALHIVSPGAPDCWLEVTTKGGNVYQTELASKSDPECPIDPEALCQRLVEMTGIVPTVYPIGQAA